MEKVKVTQKQFDWLEKYITDKEIDYAIDIQPHRKRPDSPIVDWPTSEVARALYNGYEIKPKFKEGEWITNTDADITYKTTKKDIKVISQLEKISHLRHATDEEKSIAWWKEHGRRVWEVQQEDVIYINDSYEAINIVKDGIYHFQSGHYATGEDMEILSKKGNVWIVCFAEDRKDIATS